MLVYYQLPDWVFGTVLWGRLIPVDSVRHTSRNISSMKLADHDSNVSGYESLTAKDGTTGVSLPQSDAVWLVRSSEWVRACVT